MDIDGDYISDLAMSKEIIAELEKQKQPTFIHAVTMQNHFSFSRPLISIRFSPNRPSVNGK